MVQIKAAIKNRRLNPITNVQTINLEQNFIKNEKMNPKTRATPRLANMIGQVIEKSLVDDNLSPILTPFITIASIFLLSGKHITPNNSVVGYITVVLL